MDYPNQNLSKKSGDRFWSAPSRGLTMVELLIVIAIVAILAAVAFPSFVVTTKKFRVSGEAEAFSGDLQVARSEAIKRGAAVIMCPSTDGATCSSANAWQNGWLIYNLNSDGSVNKIKVQGKWSTASKVNTDTLTGSNPSPYSITFSRDGYAQGLTGGSASDTFTAQTVPLVAEAAQCIVLSKAGRQKIQKCS